jgi:hypothetical protein
MAQSRRSPDPVPRSGSGRKADMTNQRVKCPLMTQSGHQLDAGLGVSEPLAAGLVLRQCQPAQIGSQCGYTRDVPCYIMIIPSGG